jgi:1-acyl-sn-glycerol-3-phosphate acyltransferase
MEDWKLEPAHDVGLHGLERYQSAQRESGLIESGVRLVWWAFLRGVFRVWNRLHVVGREHLPAEPPFVLVANHASHLDALLLTAALPLRWRDLTFPIAARDVFFESHPLAAFTATFVNAIPVYRRATSGRGLGDLRARLQSDPCVFVLFPEGTRTRTGAMNRFKPGVGMLVAGSAVPVVPCHIEGAYQAMPPNRWLLRPSRLTIRLGPARSFPDLPNEREGWDECARRLEEAVRALAPPGGEPGAEPVGRASDPPGSRAN